MIFCIFFWFCAPWSQQLKKFSIMGNKFPNIHHGENALLTMYVSIYTYSFQVVLVALLNQTRQSTLKALPFFCLSKVYWPRHFILDENLHAPNSLTMLNTPMLIKVINENYQEICMSSKQFCAVLFIQVIQDCLNFRRMTVPMEPLNQHLVVFGKFIFHNQL